MRKNIKFAVLKRNDKAIFYYDNKIKENEIFYNLAQLIKTAEEITDYSVQDIFQKIKLFKPKFKPSKKKLKKAGIKIFFDENMNFYPDGDVKYMISNGDIYINCKTHELLSSVILTYLIAKELHKKIIRKSKNKNFDAILKEIINMI